MDNYSAIVEGKDVGLAYDSKMVMRLGPADDELFVRNVILMANALNYYKRRVPQAEIESSIMTNTLMSKPFAYNRGDYQ